jgi:hypothetical protein
MQRKSIVNSFLPVILKLQIFTVFLVFLSWIRFVNKELDAGLSYE